MVSTSSSTSSSISIGSSCLVALLCFLVYWNSLSGDLLHDDIFAIIDNRDVRPYTPLSNLFWNDFWGKPVNDPTSHKSYRPLTVISFRFNYALHELRPWGYHLVNVLLHTICTLLVYITTETVIFNNPLFPHTISTSFMSLSLQTTLLFAVHPIHTEAVSGIVGRADILACVFFLLSLLYYHSSCVHNETNMLKLILKFTLSMSFGCCAMLCKEHGITVFGLSLVYELFIIIFTPRNHGDNIMRVQLPPPVAIVRITLLCVITGLLLLFRMTILHQNLPQFSVDDNPASFSDSLVTRVLTYSYLYYFNAKLLIMPFILSYDWQMGSIPLVESLSDWRNVFTCVFFFYLFGLVLSTVLSSKTTKRHRLIVCLGTSFAVIPFLPASNIFLRVGFVVAERILYISSIGSCILIVYGLNLLFGIVIKRFKGLSFCGNGGQAFFVLLILLFSLRTIDRNTVWQNRETLFRSGILTLPYNAKVHYNYANYLKDHDDTYKAIHHYREAIKLSPGHYSSHNNVATLLNGTEALYHYKQAIKYNPQHYKAYFNLGNYMWNHNEINEAERMYLQSISLNPNYTDALIKLSSLYALLKRYQESENLIKQTLEISSVETEVLTNCANVLITIGKISQSVTLFEQALLLDPLNSDVMVSLAKAYRLLEQNKKAEDFFLKSLSISPKASVYQSLGGLYFNTKRYRESYKMFKRSLELEPNNDEYMCNYVQACRGLEALEEIEKLTQGQSNLFCVHFNFATLLLNHKPLNLTKALIHSSKAISLSRNNKELYDAHTLHGTLLKDVKNFSESAKSFKEALDIYPDMSSSWVNLGAVMHIMGNYEEARRFYEKARVLDPTNTIVQTNLQKLNRILQK